MKTRQLAVYILGGLFAIHIIFFLIFEYGNSTYIPTAFLSYYGSELPIGVCFLTAGVLSISKDQNSESESNSIISVGGILVLVGIGWILNALF